jgi:hypothetical protein
MAPKAASALTLVLTFAALVNGDTRFHVINEEGVSRLRDSDGHPFFSFGVCVVDMGTKFEEYQPSNPAFGAWRFYPSSASWAISAIQTLKAGGFNTVGAWSDYAKLLSAPNNNLYFTPIIHSGSSAGFPWVDMWDPKLVAIADTVTRQLVDSLHRDRRIIGYFSDNELGWWRPALFQWIWQQKTPFTRRRTIALLRRRYHSWRNLRRDFEPVGATSWSQLATHGSLFLRPGGSGQLAIADVQTMLAKRYYSLLGGLIRKYDPGALYLGDRYISNYYPEVARVAGQYCDVVSTNLNADLNDGTFAKYYLDSLIKVARRPVMVTEFYMSAKANRSGNENSHSGFPVVETLAERARSATTTLKLLLNNPNVVGAHWFQYYDEPRNGRGDGENYNFGLVDVNNQAYTELLDAFKSTLSSAGNRPPAESDHPYKTEGFRFQPATNPIPRADLYIKSSEELQLRFLWPEERFTEAYFKGGKIPSSALSRLIISDRGKTILSLQLDPSHPPSTGAGPVKSAKLGTANSLELHIAGRQDRTLTISLRTESGAYTTTWQLKPTNPEQASEAKPPCPPSIARKALAAGRAANR